MVAEPDGREPDLRRRAQRVRAESAALFDKTAKLQADASRSIRRAGQLVMRPERLAGEATLFLEGELDMASAPALLEEIAVLEGSGGRIRLDLAGIDFIDAGGLDALVGLTASDGAAPATVELARPSDAVMRIARLTGTADELGLSG